MLLIPEIIAINILNILFVFFGFVAFLLGLKIVLQWSVNATTSCQYKLEKESYLASSIIKYIFYIKVPLLLFFIYLLDKLSFSISGAMCGTGVINADSFGIALLFLKVLNIYLFAYWIVLNAQDMKYESQPYIKTKFSLFLLLYFLLIVEIAFETHFFFSLDIKSVVDCCGVLFSSTNGTYLSLILHQESSLLLTLFYGNYLFLMFSKVMKQKYLFSLYNILYSIISLITLIAFFGTYIYESPTHHCPFCMLQPEYHYIGYLLYLFLFLGTFNGVVLGVVKLNKEEENEKYNTSLFFNTLYLLVVTLYPLSYIIKNGVWL